MTIYKLKLDKETISKLSTGRYKVSHVDHNNKIVVKLKPRYVKQQRKTISPIQ